MKTKIPLFALAFFAVTSISAQENNVNDSASKEDVEVVISPKKGQDSTIVKVAGMKIIVLNDL
jgi:hypothetical protein